MFNALIVGVFVYIATLLQIVNLQPVMSAVPAPATLIGRLSTLSSLLPVLSRAWPVCRDNYAVNKQLRRQLRASRKEEKARDQHRQRLGLPDHVKLLPESQGDVLAASAVDFGGQKFKQNWQHSRRSIASSSIFSPAAVAAAATGARPRKGGSTAVPALQHLGAASTGEGRLPWQATSGKKRRLDAAVKLKLSEPLKKGRS